MILVTKNLRKGSITNILPWETRRRLQTKIPKVVAILLRVIGVLLMGSNLWVGVLTKRMVVLVVVPKATR